MNTTTEPNKNFKYILITILSFFIISPLLYVAFASDGLSQEATEQAYTLQFSTTQKAVQNAKSAVEALCKIEIEHSNAKLADHFAGKKKLEQADVDRLSLKSKGENLECRNF